MNEPNQEHTPALWKEFMVEALDIIRETNPERVVMIGTADRGVLRALPELNWPADDPQLILTIHYYEPFQFTHQNAGWTGAHTSQWLGTTWNDTRQERQVIKNALLHNPMPEPSDR